MARKEVKAIQQAHNKLVHLPVNRWVGQGATVEDPDNILVPHLGPKRHGAFIHTMPQQYIATIAPPLWVWADSQRLAGAWCILATTYLDYWEVYTLRNQLIHTGLVPLSTIRYNQFSELH